MDGYQRLASAIIKQGIDDLKIVNKRIKKCEEGIKGHRSDANYLVDWEDSLKAAQGRKQALMNFFEGEWCEDLCDFIGLNGAVVRDKVLQQYGVV